MFVLALLMLIGGLAAIVQGIPFVRLEVGWTMVIAGTVGASGGAVLLGITAAVARLGRIERALSERASGAAPAEMPVRASRTEPLLPPVPIPTPPLPARQPAPEPRPAEPAGLDGGAALAAGAAVAAAGLAASELRLRRADDPDLPAEPAPHDAAPPPLPPPHAPQEPVRAVPAEEPVPAEPADAVGPEPAHDPVPTPAAAPEPEPPAQEPVIEEPPGKTVIGTYDSGDNTYTMYADGTIDADTPAGRFHFASIEELKAFRSAGGEGAARTG
ncbi:hypothetical protein EU555_34325 [Methylobacterium nonmethylotrophicum]|uniref:DUF308 domain-containing protein n=1 Tax=Methylobacterium nonmethylotrophicum TaxID=1141884 RepID=A0A4Z0ND20_9HYPH|nr:hypothetical protein EU555_34325 [Methylobacterium nonmethylotrophicum]